MPESMSELNLPATAAQLSAAQLDLNRPIPAPLSSLYRRHDGFQTYLITDTSSVMSMSFFALAAENHRTRWLLDAEDSADWNAMTTSGSNLIVQENCAFRDGLLDMFNDPLPQEVQDLHDHHLCIAADWDGSVGNAYTLDTRSSCLTVHVVPNARFLSAERFLAVLKNRKTLTLEALLEQMAAPTWLVDTTLHDDDTTLMFHSRSKDAKPGAGVGEAGGQALTALAGHPHWRRELSNFAPAPFELDGHRWRTVEHAFQAAKFKTSHPAYYRRFTLDSGDPLGMDDGAAARKAGGRRGQPMTLHQQLTWEARKREAMRRAQEARYTQNARHRQILCDTGSARLTHKPPRVRYVQIEHDLMVLRTTLRAT